MIMENLSTVKLKKFFKAFISLGVQDRGRENLYNVATETREAK